MATFLDDRDRARLMGRLAALTADSKARWGKFTVTSMMCHLRESARMASGELAVPDVGKRAFQMFPLKHLILYVMPFPKGAPTAPLLLAASPEDFEASMRQLTSALDTFLHEEQRPAPAHPLFGPLTRKEWGALVYKHTDHHLRQFGV
jgi:hypothetical protein